MNDPGKSKPRIVPRWEGGRLQAPEAGPTTESRLLAGATECLRRYGLNGTTSRAIAAAAGANLGAITYHFGSKDELVAQALLETVRGWLAPAMAILKRDMDPAERLVAAVAELQRTFTEAREILPVYLEALVSASRNDTLKRGVEELFTEVRRFLSAQLREQRDAGQLPRWVDPDAFAMLLVATADGIGLHAALEPDAVQPDALAAQAVQLLLASRGTG
ncbi:MAG: TetR/AcrR family transcriptional regulator [Actinomycetota bacterium]